MHFTRRGVIHGREGHAVQAMFNRRGIKQISGSSGEGVWIIMRKPGNHCKFCKSYGEG